LRADNARFMLTIGEWIARDLDKMRKALWNSAMAAIVFVRAAAF
jgi:hypothetical protein